MSITFRAAAGLAGQSTGTSVTFTLPTGHTLDDILLAWLGVKAYTVGVSSGTITTDYTADGNKTSGTVANGVGVGSTRMFGYHRTHDGTESAPTCTLNATPSPSMAAMSAYSKTNAGAWDIASTVGADTSASGASVSITSDAAIALAPGDTLVFGVALPDDTADMGSIAVTATGITFGTITQRLATVGTTSGNDAAMRVYDVPITAGTGTVTVTVTATNTNSGESEAAAVFVRLREPASGAATVNATAGAMSLPQTSHTVTGGGVVTETANGASLPSTAPTAIGGARVTVTANGMSLPSTSATVVGGATVAETSGVMSLPSTAPVVGSGDFVTATAGAMSLPSTSPTLIGGASVVETPGTASFPATNPTIAGGATVTVTANGMSLPSTSPTISAASDGVVSAVAGAAALPSTNVEVWASYFAYAGEMLLGETAPTIVGTSPNGSVEAVAASVTFPNAFPEVNGYGPPPILVRLKNTDVGNFIDVPRPLPPSGSRWVGLWPRLVLPATQKALLLFEDGRVQEVTSLQGDIYDLADDVIAGGTVWEGLSTSWQAQALAAAGYTLVPVEEA